VRNPTDEGVVVMAMASEALKPVGYLIIDDPREVKAVIDRIKRAAKMAFGNDALTENEH
jgi:hypothetical protein